MQRLLNHRRATGQQGGFTLVELLIAAAIMLIAISGLALLFGNTLGETASARQKQAANRLMTRALEQMRSLPYSRIQAGLKTSDGVNSTADSNVVGDATVGAGATFNGETIVTSATPTTEAPLVPHVRQVTENGTRYTISAYVTKYKAGTPLAEVSGSYRVTVITKWSDRGDVKTSSTQTVVNSPEGCVSNSTHPFGAPCQPFLYSTATTGLGGVTIQPGENLAEGIDNVGLRKAQILAPELLSALQVEQISAVNGKISAAGGKFEQLDDTTKTVGGTSGSAAADNDPASVADRQASATVNQGTGTESIQRTSANTLRITSPATGVTAPLTSSASAQSSPACNALTGLTIANGQPCGSASLQHTGSYQMQMSIFRGSDDVGHSILAKFDYGSGSTLVPPSKIHTSRHVAAGTLYCTTTSGDGCVRAGASRAIKSLDLANLPTLFAPIPVGWAGYLVRLENYSDSANSEAGVTSFAPLTTQAGTIRYWKWTAPGVGTYHSMALPNTGTIPVDPIVLDRVINGDTYRVIITPNLTAVSPTTTSTGTMPCRDAICTKSAEIPSPIQGDITYQVIRDPGSSTPDWLADIELSVDLGDLKARTSYKAAPLAG